MLLETFHWLLSPTGQAFLAETMAVDLGEQARLQTMSRLRQKLSAEQAAAVYETALLRQRGKAKFSRAEAMYFTREALEQASGELIASYRAARYRPFEHVADLCCSIGGDTVGLARHARVTAVDRDLLRLAMAAENLRAYGFAHSVTFAEADLEHDDPPPAEALFFDPARRADGRRVFSINAYVPSMAHVERWRMPTPAVGIKIAPGVSDEDLATQRQGEVEFISVDGELKEAVLWFGPLATPGRRATLLSHDGVTYTLHRETARFDIPLTPPGAFLYEPDAAVIRSHLVADVAELIGAAQLDPTIAYLTSGSFTATPFARCWRVLSWLPFSLKRLRAALNDLDVGPVTVKKRGSPLDTDALARQLSGRGAHPLVVVLTKHHNKPIALVCEGPVLDDKVTR